MISRAEKKRRIAQALTRKQWKHAEQLAQIEENSDEEAQELHTLETMYGPAVMPWIIDLMDTLREEQDERNERAAQQ